jgi:hypothetical protein
LKKKLLGLFFLSLALFIWLPAVSYAQSPGDQSVTVDWRELKTDHFIIVYAESIDGIGRFTCACGVDEAQFYAEFVDQIYLDLVAVFKVELETPINLRLFPTEESYFEVNPLAAQIPGVIAHALNSRSEIAIALPRTEPLADEQIVNNMRHELTHFFASLLSDGELTTGFQEGIAQYLEKPNEYASYDPAVLELAFENGRLLTWAELDSAQEVFRDPQVAYPEALSMVAFLVDRYGFNIFIKFLETNATEPGYRSALNATYGKPADELEAEWLAYLPTYFTGRWQINYIYAYDLSRVRELVDKGAFGDAEVELTEIVALLESTDQAEVLAEAEQLLARAHQGQAAGALADEARRALQLDDYPGAVSKGQAAISAFEAVGQQDRLQEIQTYIHRAELGQDAIVQLNEGEAMLESFRFFEAKQQIHDATVLLQSLDNETEAQRGVALLETSSVRQQLMSYAVLAIAALLIIINGIRRFLHRFSASPLEVEFT